MVRSFAAGAALAIGSALLVMQPASAQGRSSDNEGARIDQRRFSGRTADARRTGISPRHAIELASSAPSPVSTTLMPLLRTSSDRRSNGDGAVRIYDPMGRMLRKAPTTAGKRSFGIAYSPDGKTVTQEIEFKAAKIAGAHLEPGYYKFVPLANPPAYCHVTLHIRLD